MKADFFNQKDQRANKVVEYFILLMKQPDIIVTTDCMPHENKLSIIREGESHRFLEELFEVDQDIAKK